MKIKFNLFFILFLVIAVFVGFQTETAIIFMSVLSHELGHVGVALLLGVRVDEIELLPIGGVARMEDITKFGGFVEAIIACAGPLMSLALYFICMYLTKYGDVFSIGMKYNLALVLFNSIPALPMDGGRIGRNFLMLFYSYKGATRIMCLLGQALAMGFVGYNIWILYQGELSGAYVAVGLFIFAGTLKENKYMSYIYLMNVNDNKQKKMGTGEMKTRVIKASTQSNLKDLAKVFSPLYVCKIKIYDIKNDVIVTLEENEIMDGIMKLGYTAKIKDIL